MNSQRGSHALVVTALFVAFGLGAVFGALAAKFPKHFLPSPRVALAPGRSQGSDEERRLAADSESPNPPGVADSVPGDGTANTPPGYPIKGNERSGIYHVPGGFAYDRTIATICFRTVEAAEAAGYRASKS